MRIDRHIKDVCKICMKKLSVRKQSEGRESQAERGRAG